MDLGPFHQLPPVDLLLEGEGVDELVVDAVLLLAARLAGGDADAEARLGVVLHQAPGEGGLPRAGGTGKDEEQAFLEHAHSTFCTCSRIRSSSALSSTTREETSRD